MRGPGTNKRVLLVASGLVAAGALVAGCGVSVAAGHENAATHPASGIFVSNTVGGGAVSTKSLPPVTYTPPSSTLPAVTAPGLASTVKAIEAAVSGGCWQDSHAGNNYGAYDQLFWWMGDCGDAIAGITIELYPSAAKAKAEEHHPVAGKLESQAVVTSTLLARYLDGAALVDVWSAAPLSVLAQVGSVRGLQPVPGYANS